MIIIFALKDNILESAVVKLTCLKTWARDGLYTSRTDITSNTRDYI